MTYSDAALAAILDAKADQLRDEKQVPEVVLELATLLGDVDEVTISPVGDTEDGTIPTTEAPQGGLALFVPDDIAAMRCDECGGSTQTYVHTDDGVALCPNCA